jgi:zinc/manganese transport system substrate-binding protein
MNRQPRLAGLLAAGLVLLGGLSACATTPPGGAPGGSGAGAAIPVAASTNVWGSLLTQLGGDQVRATSIINSPDVDPHDYEPTPADGRVIADAKLFVSNGVGYDPWAQRALGASPDPSRVVVEVGQLTGTPPDGNPHRWYSPDDVTKVADGITEALKKVDPGKAAYFDERRRSFETTGLARYHQLITEIKSSYAGTPIGASESIVSPLADALGLRVLTPPSFLKDISEGVDPSAADKSAIDSQIAGRQLKVYVVNGQNSTPDVAAQVDAAKRAGIPVVSVTETLTPQGATFQDWQAAQLAALRDALRGGAAR